MSKQRDKGTRFETWIVRFMKPLWPDAKRTGSRAQDRGDIEGVPTFSIEAKNWQRWGHKDVAGWFLQASKEQQKEKKPAKIVWAKLHGRGNRQSIVMMEAQDFYWLVNKYDIK